jgi:hypothetical protein
VGAATGASPGSTGHAITAEHKRFALHQELSMDLSARTVLVTGAFRKDLGGGLDDRERTVSAYILTCAVLGSSAPPSVTASAADGCSSQGSRFHRRPGRVHVPVSRQAPMPPGNSIASLSCRFA